MATTPGSEGSSLSSLSSTFRLMNVSLPTSELLSPHTLQRTLGMSSTQSLWSLTHQQFHTTARSHVTLPPLPPVSETRIRVNPESHSTPKASLRGLSLPTERDFTRIQTRLTKLATGVGLTLRPLTLPEGKPLDITLEQDDWQYVKIRLYGKPTPLEVNMKKNRGKAVIYVSKSVMEPSESFHDEKWKKETVVVTEPGLRFKSEWMFLGIKCLQDVQITLNIRFGKVNESSKRKNEHSYGLSELDLFRFDEKNRSNLGESVANILKRKKQGLEMSRSSRNFLEENAKMASFRSSWMNREEEETHRLQVLERSIQIAEERRVKAETGLRKQELRRSELLKLAEEQQLHTQQTLCYQNWLSLLSLSLSVFSLQSKFLARKAVLAKAQAESRAALTIQRIYRKCIKHLNPKRLALQRATGGLRLFRGLMGPMLMPKAKFGLLQMFRDSVDSFKVREKVKKCWGNMRKIQRNWRKFDMKRKGWWKEVERKWLAAVQPQANSPTLKKPKKGSKNRRSSMIRNVLTDAGLRHSAMSGLWLEKCRMYRDELREWKRRKTEEQGAGEMEGREEREGVRFRWETVEEDVERLVEKVSGQT